MSDSAQSKAFDARRSIENARNRKLQRKPYFPPTLRDGKTLLRFIGAVETRIHQRQRALWSRFIGAGFIAEDIEWIWPDENVNNWFGIRYAGNTTEMQLEALNLRELDELLKWLKANTQDISSSLNSGTGDAKEEA